MPSSANATAPAAHAQVNIHALTEDERAELMMGEYAAQSRFQREFGADHAELDCAPFAEGFRDGVLRLLRAQGIAQAVEPLQALHARIGHELKAYGFNDGVNKISTLLYDADEAFMALYHRFIGECVQRYFPYASYFQATTTIRIHCPDGENNHHYPRYHTDIGYGHPPQEINIWIPLTAPEGEQGHGFRCMNVADSRRVLEGFGYRFAPFIDKAVNDPAFNQSLNAFAPQVKTPFGKMFAFDSRCIHTGEPLLHHTRASMDIRIIPVEDYRRMPVVYQGTGRRRIVYAPGEAYFPHSSDQLQAM